MIITILGWAVAAFILGFIFGAWSNQICKDTIPDMNFPHQEDPPYFIGVDMATDRDTHVVIDRRSGRYFL